MVNWLYHVSTRRLIIFVSAFIIFFIAALAGYRYYKYEENVNSIYRTIDYHNETIYLQELRYHSAQIQQFLTDASLTGDVEAIEEAKSHQQAITALLPNLPDVDLGNINALLVEQLDVGQKMVQAYSTGSIQ